VIPVWLGAGHRPETASEINDGATDAAKKNSMKRSFMLYLFVARVAS
jgi:hypothetical protein